MVEKVRQKISDSPVLRWSALLLIALTMFFAYMFIDVLSPLQTQLTESLGWSGDNYGTFAGSEYFLNVFAFFLIFAGIILDKMGVRFTGILSALVMVIGAGIKLYGISDYFNSGGFGYEFFNSFWTSFPASAKVASLGFMIFGCGVEMAGVTVSKAIVKWFSGKELALAMGLEMAIARLGVFAVFRLSPYVSEAMGKSLVMPVAICGMLLCIGLLTFVIYSFMDRKLDKQIGAMQSQPEEPFRVRDIGKLFASKTFMIVALLCVLYYSAIFPFQKFATSMLENRLAIPTGEASALFSWFPIGAMVLTPLLGSFLDHKGKGATMLMLGAILMCCCHLVFALVPLTLWIAYAAIILLGVSFSLVPAALWPSVPKLVENRYLGSAYSVIFWIQNIGLMLFPIIIGWSLEATNPGVTEKVQALSGQMKEITLKQDELHKKRNEYIVNLADYDSEFSAGSFSAGHRNDVFVYKYFNDMLSGVDRNLDTLSYNLAREQARERYISSMGNDVARFNSLAADSTVVVPLSIAPAVSEFDAEVGKLESMKGEAVYNYTVPMLIFSALGVLAFILGLVLKREDRKRGYGLELPNIKK